MKDYCWKMQNTTSLEIEFKKEYFDIVEKTHEDISDYLYFDKLFMINKKNIVSVDIISERNNKNTIIITTDQYHNYRLTCEQELSFTVMEFIVKQLKNS